MIVLGLDSSTDILAVGIATVDAIRVECSTETRREHASRIIGEIERCLSEGGVTKEEVDGLAVAIGPGSFTGLRVGLAAAKAFALARRIPLVGISTFEVIARRLTGYPAVLLARVRKGEYYLCDVDAGRADIEGIALVLEEDLVERINGRKAGAIGFDSGRVKGSISWLEPKLVAISGGELAQIGARRIERDETSDIVGLEPLYIAPSQAERRHGKRHV
jgi:tRNA threonylcarbamoyladenosine biosynthesis protein TsaB